MAARLGTATFAVLGAGWTLTASGAATVLLAAVAAMLWRPRQRAATGQRPVVETP